MQRDERRNPRFACMYDTHISYARTYASNTPCAQQTELASLAFLCGVPKRAAQTLTLYATLPMYYCPSGAKLPTSVSMITLDWNRIGRTLTRSVA